MTNKNKKIIAILAIIIILIIIFLLLIKGCSTKEYVVTFDTKEGSNISELKVKENGKISMPSEPTKDGYKFVGWYYNGEPFDFDTEITNDITLEAKWEKIENEEETPTVPDDKDEEEKEELKGINLNASLLTLKPDEEAKLKVTFTPNNLTGDVIWESSNEKIVTVKDGKIKGIKEGEATITVSTKDGKFTAKCKVKVSKNVIDVTSVVINGKKEVYVGESIKLTATIKPDNATNKNVKWTSDNTKIATVDQNGNVKGIKAGKVNITITTTDGAKSAKITIEVKNKKTESTPTGGETKPSDASDVKIKKISTKVDKNEIYVGETANITVTIEPSNATNKNVSYEVEKKDIIKVDNKGVVTGLKAGSSKVYITAKDGSNVSTYVTITVKNKDVPVSGITITGKNTVYVKESIDLKAIVKPDNATNKNVEWKSSNSNIATVDKSGKVQGVSAGTVTITATSTANSKVLATIDIEVQDKYELILTPIISELNVVFNYTVTATKNGESFTGYTHYRYNGRRYGSKETISKIDRNIQTGKIIIDGKEYDATIVYK